MNPGNKRILYISEVPVELSYAGATLVYRLLEQYPSDKLLVAQTSLSINGNRLNKVRYVELGSKWLKWMRKFRLDQLGNLLSVYSKQRIGARLKNIIDEFQPDAVLTVTFNLSWLTACRISAKYKIPLFLILHDDLLGTENYGIAQSIIAKKFKEAYLHAHSCFCISPEMEQHYFRIYNRSGSVLYPFRGKRDMIFRKEEERVDKKKPLNFCYAGSIGTSDFLVMLDSLAEILLRRGHTLTLFSKVPDSLLMKYKHLLMPHVSFKPMVHPDILKKYMLDEVDVNVLLNSFESEELFKLNFSSKIVDYSAVNIPVMFWGSSTSGIMRWALSNNYPCIIQNDKQVVEAEVSALEGMSYRRDLGEKLQWMANDTFSFEKNYDVFTRQLNQGI